MIASRAAKSRQWRYACVVTLLFSTVGCKNSTTAPSGTTILHSEVSDPGGDALPDPSVPVSPDLVHGVIEASSGNLTVSVQFAPGTFDPSTSRLSIDLDTDQNPATGIATANGLGVEYVLDLWAPANQVTILRAVPASACTAADPCYLPMGAAPLTIMTDGMAVTLPLSLIGKVDGRLNFRVFTYASRPGGTGTAITSDVMPDMPLAPGHVP